MFAETPSAVSNPGPVDNRTVPNAPTGVLAVGGIEQAVISFSAPSDDGGASVTGYNVTTSPGGATRIGATSPITISGLAPGPYTFSVTASNALGVGPASSPSSEVTVTVTLPTTRHVTGEVRYYAGTARVPGVQIALAGGQTINATTGGDGAFSFTLNAGEDDTLTPSKLEEVPPSQEVTTLDITLIRRHILGIVALDSPYKILAADVNGSVSVTTLDITFIRRLILGISATLPKGAWQFVPSGLVFPDPKLPWNPDPARHYAGHTFRASLSGAHQRPSPNNSTATGIASASIAGDILTYSVSYSDLAPTAAHLHGPAGADADAGVIVPFTLTGSSGSTGVFSGTATLTASQKLAIIAGNSYVNIHTAAFAGGEIRGQLVAVPEPGTLAGQDFIGIRLGDVNNSWAPAATPGPLSLNDESALLTPRLTDPAGGGKKVLLEMPSVRVAGGGTIEVPLKVSGFDKVTSFQFTLGWNPRLLRFQGLRHGGLTGLESSNFNLSNTSKGRLVCSWDDVSGLGQTLGDGSVLLRLQFSVVDTHSAVSPVRFLSAPAGPEITVDSVVSDAALQEGLVWIGTGPEDVRLLTPALDGASASGRDFQSIVLSVQSVLGLTYSLEFADSLSERFWRKLKGFAGSGESIVITDVPPVSGQRFDRFRATLEIGSAENEGSARD